MEPLQISSQVTAHFRKKSSYDLFSWVCFLISLYTFSATFSHVI